MAEPDPGLARLDALLSPALRGEQRSARCPAHDDRVASLSYAPGESTAVVLTCHAGCRPEEVLSALGMTLADIAGTPHVVAEYPYTTIAGDIRYRVQRWANPKTFRCVPGLPPLADRILYGMPWVGWAHATGEPVYVVEGEKDADRLHSLGIAAVTNVGGAGRGKWLQHYSDALAGLAVRVVADDDPPGRRHARAVAESLAGIAASVTVLVPGHGCNDISDWLDSGRDLDGLRPLPTISDAAEFTEMIGVPDVRTEWAWPGRIPYGNLTLIDGDPGDGKSTLTLDLSARWSTGTALPDGATTDPVPVITITAEDDIATLARRLRAAGADLARIHPLVRVWDNGEKRPFDIGLDIGRLEDGIRQLKARIVIIDPLMSFMPERTDTYRDHSVRRALLPLVELAEEYRLAIIAIRHLSKSATRALYSGGGSIAFIGAARAGYLIARDPTDPDIRVLAATKANLARLPGSLRFRLTEHRALDTAAIDWLGPSGLSAQDLLNAANHVDRDAPLTDEATEWLAEWLADAGRATWHEITRAARAAGVVASEHTLRNARQRLGLAQSRAGQGPDYRVQWSLPRSPDLAPHSGVSDGQVSGLPASGGTGKPQTTRHVVSEAHKPETDMPDSARSRGRAFPTDSPELSTGSRACAKCGRTGAFVTLYRETGEHYCPIHSPLLT